jgi:hypothetical protein
MSDVMLPEIRKPKAPMIFDEFEESEDSISDDDQKCEPMVKESSPSIQKIDKMRKKSFVMKALETKMSEI